MKTKNKFIDKLIILLVFFNVWFPKSGFKIHGIPVTIGNIVFFALLFAWIIMKIKSKRISSNKIVFIIILSIIYFTIKYTMIYNYSSSLLNYVTYIIPLIIYPVAYIIMIDQIESYNQIKKIYRIIYYGFYMICLYAIIQFIFGIENTTIPGITVNYTDYKTMGSTWFMQKSNGMDIHNSKIVSTYQNGNLLGINLLLIYPLIYNMLKFENKNKQLFLSLILFILCGFLTLSRTTWLGLVLFLLFGVIFESEKNKNSFARKVFIVIFSIISIIFVFKYMPSVINRFLNTSLSDWINMSGRTDGLIKVFKSVNESNSILAYIVGPEGIISYTGLAFEMLPLAVFVQTGIIGLLLIYALYFNVLKILKYNNPITKGIKMSIKIWLIIGCIECGYWLPPTALNIFILLAIACVASKIEGEREKNENSSVNSGISSNTSN